MKRADIFEKIEPRPGGLTRLRQRVDGERSRARARWAGWRASTVGLALVAAVLLIMEPPKRGRLLALARGTEGTSEVALGLAQPPTAALTLSDDSAHAVALQEIETSDRNVRLYRVGALGD